MRSTYGSSERQRSRQRTVREGQYSIPRDTSPDDSYRHTYSSHHQFAKRKRVKFNDEEDIRVFRKQDEPIAKSLTEEEIFLIKKQIEKQVSRIYDFNWDQKKHFDALSEQNSMKEQKQKQKQLYQKLMSMKEEIQFYPPYALALPTNSDIPIAGSESIEKQAHTDRTKDVLGCYYTQVNEIPNEPIFEVTAQANKSQPKVIFFNPGGLNEGAEFVKSSKFFVIEKDKTNEKELKGILKMAGQAQRVSVPKKSVERQISPRLLWLLKEMQVNKEKYNKEMTELLLKPYKETGELEYWMANQQALNEKLKSQPVGVPPPPSNIPIVTTPPPAQPVSHFQPGPSRMSPSPTNEFRPQFQNYDPVAQKAQKFKTVPCKFYHGALGCVKTQNCTFIHDEQYRGVPHPLMLQQQYRQYSSSGYENRGGFQGNPNFQRRQNFQTYGGYQGHHQGSGFHQNKPFHHQGHKKYDNYQNQPGSYQQSSYNPQQRQYQNYGQQPQMNQPSYQQQMGQQMGQSQQQMPGYTTGYSSNPQQQQQQQYMYYGQGQMGGGMQQRNPNQK